MAKSEVRFKTRGDCVVMQSGGGWVKALRFHGGRRLSLVRASVLQVEQESDYEQLAKELFRKGKFGSHGLIGCLPRSDVNVRLLELPSTKSSEIEDMVELQVGRLTPYSREEVHSQYRCLGLTRGDTYTKVMLSIVQRACVRDRYCHLEATGENVERMTVSTEGLLNWALHTCVSVEEQDPVAVLDVDAESCELLVVCQHVLVFSKSVRIGARQLATDEAALDRLASEVEQSLDVYHAESGGLTVIRLIATGAMAPAEQAAERLTHDLGLACEVCDPLRDVQLASGVGLDDNMRNGCSVAALVGIACLPDGLALDFEPEVVRMRRSMKKVAKECSHVAALISIVLSLVVVYATLAYGFRYREWKGLHDVNVQMAGDVKSLQEKAEQTTEANKRLDMTLSPVNMLGAVESGFVEGVAVASLDYSADTRKLTVKGTSDRRSTSAAFVGNLSTNSFFQSVEDRSEGTMTPEGRYAFEVVCVVGGGS